MPDRYKTRCLTDALQLEKILNYEYQLGWRFVGSVTLNVPVGKDCFPEQADYMILERIDITTS